MNRYKFLFISLIIIFTYWGVWNGFFQQDEWAGLGGFFSLDNLNWVVKLTEMYGPMFRSGVAHFLPFLPITNSIRYSLFGLNYTSYALLSVVIHIIAVCSVYFLALKISKDKLVALLSSLLFGVSAAGSQAVIWVGTSVPTQVSLIFSCWSIIYWFDWVYTQSRKKLYFSIIFLVLAFGFKETSLFLLIFLPISLFILKSKVDKKVLLSLLAIASGYVMLRIFILSISSNLTDSLLSTFNLFKNALVNYLQILIRGVGQALIPQEILLITGKKIFLNIDSAFFENMIIRWVFYISGGIFFLLSVLRKNQKILIYLAIIVTSFIPLSFISTGELMSTFISPRNLYIPVIGVSGIVGEIFGRLKYKYRIFLIIWIGIVLLNILVVKYQIKNINKIGSQREMILNQIKSDYPNLSSKTVFYIQSDTAYYGLGPDIKIPPFQSGFGQTLLVWYYPNEKFPREFFKNRFLWEIQSQGYNEFDDRGFGYFRDFDLLREALNKYKIPLSSVIAYRWDGQAGKLIENSKMIRESLGI